MKTGIILFATVLAFASARKSLPCFTSKLLRSDSADNAWFKITLVPNESDNKFQKLLYGNGWLLGESSFKVESDRDQIVKIEAADGSPFTIRKLSLKTTNTDAITFMGINEEGTEVEYKITKDPREMTRFEKWEKTGFRDRKTYISQLIMRAALHNHSADDAHRLHRIYMRGLKVTVCPKYTAYED